MAGMSKAEGTASAGLGQIREGTALRASGRRTAARIVEAAYDMLKTGDSANFSLRNVAEAAGIRLGNLQYYFQRREDLIRAVLDHVGEVYNRRYDDLLAAAPDSAEGRFEAVIRWNFEDVGATETRHFFIQFWGLLSEADDYTGELLAQLYAPQLRRLQERILELVPALDPDNAQLRAEIIAAMIEGFTVQAPASSQLATRLGPLCDLTVETAFRIARGPVSNTDKPGGHQQ